MQVVYHNSRYFEEVSCSLALAFTRGFKNQLCYLDLHQFFFQYAFKDIIARANSSDVLVHLFHKSSCTIFIPLGMLDKFYKILFSLVFVCSLLLCIFVLLYNYFRDCVHLHDFILEKNT